MPPVADILVTDDDVATIKTLSATLEDMGYRVATAGSGKEALALIRERSCNIIIADIKLPDMSGNEVYPLIMEARPDLKVIVCSGYSIDGPAREILDAGAEGFIQKPFSLATLAEKLKEVLEGG